MTIDSSGTALLCITQMRYSRLKKTSKAPSDPGGSPAVFLLKFSTEFSKDYWDRLILSPEFESFTGTPVNPFFSLMLEPSRVCRVDGFFLSA